MTTDNAKRDVKHKRPCLFYACLLQRLQYSVAMRAAGLSQQQCHSKDASCSRMVLPTIHVCSSGRSDSGRTDVPPARATEVIMSSIRNQQKFDGHLTAMGLRRAHGVVAV